MHGYFEPAAKPINEMLVQQMKLLHVGVKPVFLNQRLEIRTGEEKRALAEHRQHWDRAQVDKKSKQRVFACS